MNKQVSTESFPTAAFGIFCQYVDGVYSQAAHIAANSAAANVVQTDRYKGLHTSANADLSYEHKAKVQSVLLRELQRATYSFSLEWASVAPCDHADQPNDVLHAIVGIKTLADRLVSEHFLLSLLKQSDPQKATLEKALVISVLAEGMQFWPEKLSARPYTFLGNKLESSTKDFSFLLARINRLMKTRPNFNGFTLVELCYDPVKAHFVEDMVRMFEDYFRRKMDRETNKAIIEGLRLDAIDVASEVKKAKAYVKRYYKHGKVGAVR